MDNCENEARKILNRGFELIAKQNINSLIRKENIKSFIHESTEGRKRLLRTLEESVKYEKDEEVKKRLEERCIKIKHELQLLIKEEELFEEEYAKYLETYKNEKYDREQRKKEIDETIEHIEGEEILKEEDSAYWSEYIIKPVLDVTGTENPISVKDIVDNKKLDVFTMNDAMTLNQSGETKKIKRALDRYQITKREGKEINLDMNFNGNRHKTSRRGHIDFGER